MACSVEQCEPYEKAGQCYSSQDKIAKMEYDTFVGYIPASNTYGVGWKTNSGHFRYNVDFSEEKPTDEYRIFITGGSAAWGAGVNQEQTFANLLENRLNSSGLNKKFRVIIAAAGAWA